MGRTRTLKLYPVDEILPLTGKEEKRLKCTVDGKDYFPSLHSLRYDTFRINCTCVNCGRVGTLMGLDIQSVHEEPHFNLYCMEDSKVVLMTKDHIIPKSKGGPNYIDNMQTMCSPCNVHKGNGDKPVVPIIEEFEGLRRGTVFFFSKTLWRISNFKPENEINKVVIKRVRNKKYSRRKNKSVEWVKEAIDRDKELNLTEQYHKMVENGKKQNQNQNSES